MTRDEFDVKYKDKGGFARLVDMMNDNLTQRFIARHFGISRSAVALWSEQMLNRSYDPRKTRKEKIIDVMLKFAEKHSFQDFKEAYYHAQAHNFDLAVSEAIARGIYTFKDVAK